MAIATAWLLHGLTEGKPSPPTSICERESTTWLPRFDIEMRCWSTGGGRLPTAHDVNERLPRPLSE
jgi:hypothetical protein